jgi:hypothetical protein
MPLASRSSSDRGEAVVQASLASDSTPPSDSASVRSFDSSRNFSATRRGQTGVIRAGAKRRGRAGAREMETNQPPFHP